MAPKQTKSPHEERNGNRALRKLQRWEDRARWTWKLVIGFSVIIGILGGMLGILYTGYLFLEKLAGGFAP